MCLNIYVSVIHKHAIFTEVHLNNTQIICGTMGYIILTKTLIRDTYVSTSFSGKQNLIKNKT